MNTPSPHSAIVLFAHGSRDPQWHHPIQSVAARVSQKLPGVPVRCAYLELTPPSLAEVADALVAEGVQSLRVVPFFLGMGRHAREDLPQMLAQLRERHPQLQIHCQPSLGETPAVLELLAEVALGEK